MRYGSIDINADGIADINQVIDPSCARFYDKPTQVEAKPVNLGPIDLCNGIAGSQRQIEVGPVSLGPISLGGVDLGTIDLGKVNLCNGIAASLPQVGVKPINLGPVDIGPIDL